MKIFPYIIALFILITLVYSSVPDDDGDGIPDDTDVCANTTTTIIDDYGCSCDQKTPYENCTADYNNYVGCCRSDDDESTYDCIEVNYKAACDFQTVQSCFDSDVVDEYPDGRNYYMKGTVEINYSSSTESTEDQCMTYFEIEECENCYQLGYIESCEGENCYLLENYCEGINSANDTVLCSAGCSYGACTYGGATCEDHLTCPEDCLPDSKDGYCEREKNGKCDPDCTPEEDTDCIQKAKLRSLLIVSASIILTIVLVITVWVKKRKK